MAEKLKKCSEGLPQDARPEKTHKTSDPRPHLVELDGLRGIAIMMVVLTHTLGGWSTLIGGHLLVPLLGVDLLDLRPFGHIAIPLFFLLSGYLLTWTEEGRRRRGSYSALNYAKRRALRIVPAYYVAIVVFLLVSVLLMQFRPSFGVVALHLTFLHGFWPSYPYGLDLAWWSITPEIVFYAALPLLVLKFRKFSQRVAILALLFLVSLTTRILQAYDTFGLSALDGFLGIDRLHFFPTTPLYLFLAGVLLRMMVERRTEAGHEPGRGQPFLASALTVVPLAVLLVFLYPLVKTSGILHHPAALILEAMIILLFASIVLGSPILKPVLGFGPLVFLGEISYSLFLLHNVIILTIYYYTQDTVRALVAGQSGPVVLAAFVAFASVAVAAAAALAYLSYRYIESPFMRHKPK